MVFRYIPGPWMLGGEKLAPYLSLFPPTNYVRLVILTLMYYDDDIEAT